MKRIDKLKKLQNEYHCEIHPNIKQSIGKGGKRICRQCERDMKHQRDIVSGKIQTTYSKPKEILTPMGNQIR